MRHLLAFFILSAVKTFSHIFYRSEFKWISSYPEDPWKKTKLLVFMNHTSLYEPLFLRALSYSFLWYLSNHISVPGADITLKRPIVGRFWKLMVPNISSITRKKDSSWDTYLETINSDSIIVIAPEGRMKRPNGLDKNGRPMTIRGGVADIIENLNEGGIVLCLSGGLHHIQIPGETVPRLFKKIKMNFMYLDIKDYKNQFSKSARERKLQIVHDLQDKLENYCPKN